MVYITDEMKAELELHPSGIQCENPDTKKVYVLVEEAIYKQAMAAVQQRSVIEAVNQGMADFKAGRCYTPEETYQKIRQSLGLHPEEL